MALIDVFTQAADTIFTVFESLIVDASYVTVEDDGFDESVETPYPITLIIDGFAERDVQFLSFSNLIQPTDVKGLVRGSELTSVKVSTQDVVTVGDERYAIIAHNTDPAKAVYTLLLRNV